MTKRRLPTEKEAADLREMHKNGAPRIKMQRHFSIGSNALLYWHLYLDLEPKQGVSSKRRSGDLSDEEKFIFIAYYAKKPTQDQVLKKYNIALATFEKWLKQLGIEKHDQSVKSEFGRTAIMISDRRSRKTPEDNDDTEPFVSISQKFRNYNGHDSVKLTPYRQQK